MAAEEETHRDADSIRTDQIGKVFIFVGQGVRKCIVCEQFFTRRTASHHARVVCMPGIGMKTGRK